MGGGEIVYGVVPRAADASVLAAGLLIFGPDGAVSMRAMRGV